MRPQPLVYTDTDPLFRCVWTSHCYGQFSIRDRRCSLLEVLLTIPNSHPALPVGGVPYDLSHLDAFAVVVTGKGRDPGTHLNVLVKFSNHVFTERALHGQPHDTVDHNGSRRAFDQPRYDMSLRLPDIISQAFADDALCLVSKDFGGHENLMMIELENGETWSIVFCFQPLKEGVVMEILSTHPKAARRNQKRGHLTFFARRSLFQQERVPKN